MKTVDGIFDYKVDQWSGRTSTCRVRVYQYLADGAAVAVSSEVAENKGPSVTNSAEALATALVKEYGLDPEKTHFIEHYDHESGDLDALAENQDETYDLVLFSWRDGLACCANWKPTGKEVIENLIGEKLS